MGETNESSGVCAAIETIEAIETADAKSIFSHLLVHSRTRILLVGVVA